MDNKQKLELEIFAAQIRIGVVEEMKARGFGHLGGSLSICDALAVLYGAVMHYDPKNPQWPDRDKLVSSKGHAGPAVYAALALKGFFPYEDILTLNQPGTSFPSHCDKNKTPGVDMTTGSLGQGTSLAVGMAVGDGIKGRPSRTYLIVGDGESCEGSIWEAAIAGASYHLGNLCVLIDRNKQFMTTFSEETIVLEPYADKWRAFGWNTVEVDGHDMAQLVAALDALPPAASDKPTAIVCSTVKGKGVSFMEHNIGWHAGTLKTDDMNIAIKEVLDAHARAVEGRI